MPLLVEQKNQVLRLVEQLGLDPRDFAWDAVRTEQGMPTVERLTHSTTGHFFIFGFADQRSYVIQMEDRLSIFAPGPDRGGSFAVKGYGWESQLEHCRIWLRALKSEVETVSLWDTLGTGAARDLALASFNDHKLTREQQREIQLRAQRVRQYLRSNVDDPNTMRRIEAKLDYLVDSSKRLGAKDFANVSLALLLAVALEAALNPHQAQEMVNLFTIGLRALLGG